MIEHSQIHVDLSSEKLIKRAAIAVRATTYLCLLEARNSIFKGIICYDVCTRYFTEKLVIDPVLTHQSRSFVPGCVSKISHRQIFHTNSQRKSVYMRHEFYPYQKVSHTIKKTGHKVDWQIVLQIAHL